MEGLVCFNFFMIYTISIFIGIGIYVVWFALTSCMLIT